MFKHLILSQMDSSQVLEKSQDNISKQDSPEFYLECLSQVPEYFVKGDISAFDF